MADYRNEKYSLLCTNANKYFSAWEVDLESIRRMGILQSTHEMVLIITIDNKTENVRLESAWEIAYGSSWSYNETEQKEFEDDHKGLLNDIQSKLKDGRIEFKVQDHFSKTKKCWVHKSFKTLAQARAYLHI